MNTGAHEKFENTRYLSNNANTHQQQTRQFINNQKSWNRQSWALKVNTRPRQRKVVGETTQYQAVSKESKRKTELTVVIYKDNSAQPWSVVNRDFSVKLKRVAGFAISCRQSHLTMPLIWKKNRKFRWQNHLALRTTDVAVEEDGSNHGETRGGSVDKEKREKGKVIENGKGPSLAAENIQRGENEKGCALEEEMNNSLLAKDSEAQYSKKIFDDDGENIKAVGGRYNVLNWLEEESEESVVESEDNSRAANKDVSRATKTLGLIHNKLNLTCPKTEQSGNCSFKPKLSEEFFKGNIMSGLTCSSKQKAKTGPNLKRYQHKLR